MKDFPERISKYCEVNGLTQEHILFWGSFADGKIEDIGDYASTNKLNIAKGQIISDILPDTQTITNDLFFPNYSFNGHHSAHLHLLADGVSFYVFASPNNLYHKGGSNTCISDCEHIKLTKEQMRDLIKQQDQFINLISHDFRSPLSTLIEGVDLVHANLIAKYELNELDQVIMEELKEELVQLLNYTNKLHNWAKLDTKADPTLFDEILFDHIISDQHNYFHVKIQEKNIVFIKNYNSDLKFRSDSKLLSEVIHQLIDNSIKFSANNSQITIDATTNFIRISDSGEGILPENLEQIRKGYLIRNRKLYGKAIGPGLGLNIVSRILSALNYSFEIGSEIGKGTSFTIKIS